MGSEFSFRGIGEPIRQLRELLKDLWYRNKHEKEQGEIELLRHRIELVQCHRNSSGTNVSVTCRLEGIEEAGVAIQSLLRGNSSHFGDDFARSTDVMLDRKATSHMESKSKSKRKRRPR